MADRTQARVANHNDIASDDPFAELTRIMGFDPREPVQRQAAPQPRSEQAEDFDIDLEKELMGEFDAYQEEPVAAAPQLTAEPHADEMADGDFVASMEPEFHAGEPPAPAVSGPVEDDAPDFDFAAAVDNMDERALDEAVDDEVPSEVAPTGQQFEDYEAAMSDVDFGDLDFADEATGEPVATIEPVIAEQIAAEPVAEVPAAFAAEPSAAHDDFNAHFDTAMADVNTDFSARDEASVVAAAEAEVEPTGSEHTFMPTFGHLAQPADIVAESEPDFDIDLDDAFNDESEAVAIATAEPEAAEPVAMTSEPVAEVPSVADQDRSLEDELNALLGRMTARSTAAPAAEAEAWRPQFAATSAAVEHPVQYDVDADLDAALVQEFTATDIEDASPAGDDIDFDTDAFDAAMASDLDTLDEKPTEQVEEDPVEALKWATPAAAAAAATATFAQPMRAWSRGNPVAPSSQSYSASAQPYPAPAQQYSASVQQFSAPTQLTPVQPATPVEPRMATAPQPVVQPAAESWQEPAQPVREDVPDIETMDVPERVVALADDLDIPEVPFEQDKPETSNFDELDAEFSTLLNEMLPDESAAPVKAALYDDDAGNGYKRDRVEMPAYADSPQAAAAAAVYADLGYQGYDSRSAARTTPAADQIADDGFDYDPNLEEGMTIPDAAAAEAEEAPRRRGMLIAALVGAVAVAGGVGAFAFSGGGSSSEAPAIVKADNQPMKVKPENPGGVVIPNQNNKVYDAVAKGARPAAPTQPKLVANAEEPVDVVAREQAEQAERTAAFAGTDDGEGDLQAQATATQQPVKSEDRVAQIAQENAGTQEGALVTPRKVRTMVVKPDGTLAPREELAAAPVTASEPADPTPPRVAQDQTGTVPQTGADQPVLKPAKPSTVAATPSAAPVAPQRPSDQPVDIAGGVKPQAQQQQQVASAQPQAPAPATGGWSMQIASQPTVEGAQSTYQDLARRYSNVLAGRSANIVKADVAGKGTFYRVRVMAQSREDAIKLCTSYKAAGGNCFVSK